MAGKKADKDKERVISLVNRQARHEYDISDTLEAGVMFTGTEVKSIRLGRANLQDSFCRVIGNELWVYNLHVSPYEQGNRYNVEPRRPRKCLIHKWQLVHVFGKVQEKGLTIVPTRLYFKNGFAKLEVGIGKGRKLWDKREVIADRDRDREARRELAARD